MNQKITDYVKEKELEDIITSSLIDHYKFLMIVREEMTKELAELDEQIDDIVMDMGKVGIELP